MSSEGLWTRSAAWRWTVVLTCLATATLVLLGPWRRNATVLQNSGVYHAVVQTQGLPNAPAQQNSAVAVNKTVIGHDEIFDVVVSPIAVGFPPGTELHIIGVYAGALPNGQKEQPWWAKCGSDKSNPATMLDCHQQYAGQHTQKTITVTVSGSLSPKVLALMAYEPVKWKIVGAETGNVSKIIIGGYHGQDADGVGAEIPVEVYSYESSPCQICSRQSSYFYAFQKDTPEYAKALDKLQTITGLNPTSFQGAHSSDRFTIAGTSPAVRGGGRSISAKHPSDPISGQRFVDQLSIANAVVPLPEGEWQGIVYAQNPSNRGGDELAVLAKIEQGKLMEMTVIRSQFASDGKGFSRHAACDTTNTHAGKSEVNEAFGVQRCFWLSHDTAPWEQPIFNLAANRLTTKGIELPGFFVNSIFHKADNSSALTVAYLSNPEAKGIAALKTAWDASPWHPKYVNQFPDKTAFIQDRAQWANTWFQIFKATR